MNYILITYSTPLSIPVHLPKFINNSPTFITSCQSNCIYNALCSGRRRFIELGEIIVTMRSPHGPSGDSGDPCDTPPLSADVRIALAETGLDSLMWNKE